MSDQSDYIRIVANGLKEHCEQWEYDWIKKLKVDNSIKNFRRLFLKVTHLFYVDFKNDCYNVTFDKKVDIAYVKKCGEDFDKRGIDATIKIEELIKMLVK